MTDRPIEFSVANVEGNPDLFGIDAPYTDRDREMFVLGYEFARASGWVHVVAAGGPPSEQTIHEANVDRLTAMAGRLGLDATSGPVRDGMATIRVERRR